MAEYEGGGPSPIAETIFTVLPTARKLTGLLDRVLNIYDPVLAGHCSPPVSQPKPPTAPMNPPAVLLKDLDQSNSMMEPQTIDGLKMGVNCQLNDRIGASTNFQYGNGMPMFGVPGLKFEKTLSWMGNDFVNYEGQLAPNMQLMIGPFNYSEMIKGDLGGMQLVTHGRNSQTVFMNQANYNQWKVMVLAHKQTIQKGPLNMKMNTTLQAPGGISGIYSGQCMAEIEAVANVGSFRGMNVHVGGSMGTQIPANDGNKMSYLTGPLTAAAGAALGTSPYIIFQKMPSPYQQCHAFDTNDSIALRWSRAENKAKITISSSPAGDGMSLSQAIKSPHYLKEVPKAERMELNQWANSERHGYLLNCEYDYAAHLMNYSVAWHTKFFNNKSGIKVGLEGKPGEVIPSSIKATLTDNMMFKSSGKPEDASPLTLELSLAYEVSDAPKAPKIGLAFNVEL